MSVNRKATSDCTMVTLASTMVMLVNSLAMLDCSSVTMVYELKSIQTFFFLCVLTNNIAVKPL